MGLFTSIVGKFVANGFNVENNFYGKANRNDWLFCLYL